MRFIDNGGDSFARRVVLNVLSSVSWQLVDQTILKREQFEEEIAVGGAVMAWLRSSSVERAQAPASGAGPGIRSHRADYRKSVVHLHPAGGDRGTADRAGVRVCSRRAVRGERGRQPPVRSREDRGLTPPARPFGSDSRASVAPRDVVGRPHSFPGGRHGSSERQVLVRQGPCSTRYRKSSGHTSHAAWYVARAAHTHTNRCPARQACPAGRPRRRTVR